MLLARPSAQSASSQARVSIGVRAPTGLQKEGNGPDQRKLVGQLVVEGEFKVPGRGEPSAHVVRGVS
jgi:hypothetical protein